MKNTEDSDDQARKDQVAAFRQRSGNFNSYDPLTTLFYLLIRDHVSPGEIENLVNEVIKSPDEIRQFTNGWLGQYAQDLAIRIYQAGEKSIKP